MRCEEIGSNHADPTSSCERAPQRLRSSIALSLSRALSLYLSRSLCRARAPILSRSISLLLARSRSLALALALALTLALSLARTRSLSLALSLSLSYSLRFPADASPKRELQDCRQLKTFSTFHATPVVAQTLPSFPASSKNGRTPTERPPPPPPPPRMYTENPPGFRIGSKAKAARPV